MSRRAELLGIPLVLALLLAGALGGALILAGCTVENDTEPEPERVAQATAQTDTATYRPREAITPIDGFDRYDEERIEAERHDSSWRDYASEDREYRSTAYSDRRRGAGSARDGERAPASPSPTRSVRETGPNPVLDRLGRSGTAAGQAGNADSQDPREQDESGQSGSAAGSESSTDAPPETWDAIAPDAFDAEPWFPVATEGGGPTVLRIQWLLDRARFSPGVIDGRWGKNTEKAVYWLQSSLGMDPTGTVDRALYDRLAAAVGEGSPVREHRLTAADLEGPFVEIPEETEAKADLDCLCYGSVEEKLAETFHTTPELLAQLNPDADLASLAAGDSLWVPAVEVVEPGEPGEGGSEQPVDRIVISRGGFYLHALDADGDVLYHFPSTLGNEYDPSPEGEWRVEGVAWRPEFHYQPALFSDVPDNEEDLMLPPGPNSPVGQVWLSLSKENYGIHGTAEPATIGYTSSHGCIRLTNWDAIFLGHRVKPGTPVEFRN
jgi:lipoprotein-anchoring transpeptidase ErfK/SrfK